MINFMTILLWLPNIKVLAMDVQIFKQPGILLRDILQNLDAWLPKYVCFLSFDNMFSRPGEKRRPNISYM